ncbi:MAG: hypothetical protein ACREVJ_10430, partial [Gammaproteobacteria bacterium]
LQLLSLVDAQHATAREHIAELDKRIKTIEVELPTLKLVRKWVLAALIGIASLVGYAVLAQVLPK